MIKPIDKIADRRSWPARNIGSSGQPPCEVGSHFQSTDRGSLF